MVRNISRFFKKKHLFSCPPSSNMWTFWGFLVSFTEILMPLQQHFSQETQERQGLASEANKAKGSLGRCPHSEEEQGGNESLS